MGASVIETAAWVRGGVDVSGTPDTPDTPDTSRGQSKASKLNEAWQNYGLSLVFVGVVPLLPILIELLVRGKVTEGSLFVTAAIYSITIALASNNRFYFGFFLVASIIEAAMYGSTVNGITAHPVTGNLVGMEIVSNSSSGLSESKAILVAILVPFVSLLVERFSRHVIVREEFFEFLKSKEA
jgi:hypothetical protein